MVTLLILKDLKLTRWHLKHIHNTDIQSIFSESEHVEQQKFKLALNLWKLQQLHISTADTESEVKFCNIKFFLFIISIISIGEQH